MMCSNYSLEPTTVLRLADSPPKLELPLFSANVPAGFPSPADDHIEGKLDLNEHLVRRPAATFFVRASGESMRDAGIFDGDLLIIDRGVSKSSASDYRFTRCGRREMTGPRKNKVKIPNAATAFSSC